jgi:hypothetical protein
MRPSWAGGLPASGPGGFYVVLAIVALLFCHGAFGYAHQLPPADTPAAHVTHAAGGHQPGLDQDADGAHLGGAYFATLLLLLFATSLLLGGGVSVRAKLAVSTIRQRGHKVRILPPPRGPTLFSLQVFRL